MAESNSFSSSEASFPCTTDYREQALLGKGKFEATVLYETPDKIHSKAVLKFICSKDILEDEEGAMTDIESEVKELIGNVRHPHVIAYLDLRLNPERRQLGIKMEYLSNGSLFNLIERGVKIPWALCESILCDITTGLAYLHREISGQKPKIIHENLHLNNVLLTSEFKAKVSDYGLKNIYALTRNFAANNNSYDDLKYRAPERVKDITEACTEASDIYAFGIVVYAMLKHSTDPFAPMKADEIKQCIEKGQSVVDVDLATRMNEDCPQVLLDTLQRATEFTADNRTGFAEMHRNLDQNIDRRKVSQDVEDLKEALLNSPPRRPPSPAAAADADIIDEPSANQASAGTAGICSKNGRESSPYQQGDDEESEDCNDVSAVRGKVPEYRYKRSPEGAERSPEDADTSPRNSSSANSSAVLFPPSIEQQDVGDDDVDCTVAADPAACVANGQVDHNRTNRGPAYYDNPEQDLSAAMGNLTIQPDRQPQVPNGHPFIPNLPDFHQPGSASPIPPGTPTSSFGQVQSPAGSIPQKQTNLSYQETRVGGVRVVNISSGSTVIHGNNHVITIKGTSGRGKQAPAPLSDHEQKVVACKRRLRTEEMEFIAKHTGNKWCQLGRSLGFSQGQLDTFKADNHGLHEVIYQMLLAWTERVAEDATVGCLASHLTNINKRSIVKKLSP